MHLIQIGQSPATTIQQLIQQMAEQQSAEIEQLRRDRSSLVKRFEKLNVFLRHAAIASGN